jgi:hypothetical protein
MVTFILDGGTSTQAEVVGGGTSSGTCTRQ